MPRPNFWNSHGLQIKLVMTKECWVATFRKARKVGLSLEKTEGHGSYSFIWKG